MRISSWGTCRKIENASEIQMPRAGRKTFDLLLQVINAQGKKVVEKWKIMINLSIYSHKLWSLKRIIHVIYVAISKNNINIYFFSVFIFTYRSLFAMSWLGIFLGVLGHKESLQKVRSRGEDSSWLWFWVLSFCLPASGCLELLLRVAFWLSELFSLCVVRGVGFIFCFFFSREWGAFKWATVAEYFAGLRVQLKLIWLKVWADWKIAIPGNSIDVIICYLSRTWPSI